MKTYLANLRWLNTHLSLIEAYRSLPKPARNEDQLRALVKARIAVTAHLLTLFSESVLQEENGEGA